MTYKYYTVFYTFFIHTNEKTTKKALFHYKMGSKRGVIISIKLIKIRALF